MLLRKGSLSATGAFVLRGRKARLVAPTYSKFPRLRLQKAASGFEPLHRGFADLSLSHLGTPPD